MNNDGEVRRFVHATTLTTNLVLERKGSRVAYVTPAGFRDMFGIGKRLPLGRANFDILSVRPAPFVRRKCQTNTPADHTRTMTTAAENPLAW